MIRIANQDSQADRLHAIDEACSKIQDLLAPHAECSVDRGAEARWCYREGAIYVPLGESTTEIKIELTAALVVDDGCDVRPAILDWLAQMAASLTPDT